MSASRSISSWTAYPYVTVATYFLDYDRGTMYQQGLFDSSFRPKPAAAAFSRFMQSVAKVAPIRRTTNTPAPAALP